MHHDAPQTPTEDGARATAPDRRRVMMLGAVAGLGVAGVTGLAGCGSDSASTTDTGAGATSAGAAASDATSGGAASGEAASGGALAKLADVPVGGSYAAKGADGQPIIISQPQAGTVVAFSAVCTHQGCKVEPKDKVLNCPCHQSTFDPVTGKNLSGPAPSPLPAVAVKVSGTDVVAG